MASDLVLIRDEGGARIITLNRADKRNAFNLELGFAFRDALIAAAEATDVRTIIVNGAGKSFSAGIDFFAFATIIDLSGNATFRRAVRELQEIPNAMARVEKPVIAVVHGHCIGMALEMALACDLRIAEVGCKINIEEVRLGLIPDVGGSTRLVRAIGLPRAKELIMTGRTITPETAAQWGLVNEVAPAGEGLAAALRWHEEFCAGAPNAVGLAKKVLDLAYDLDTASSMQIEALAQSTLVPTEDFKEGVAARIEKRAPKWKGR
jgi:enoyl-CoA hydratase/carnithine racemase